MTTDNRNRIDKYETLDWLVHTYAPAWLDLAGLTENAEGLRNAPRVTDRETAERAQRTVDWATRNVLPATEGLMAGYARGTVAPYDWGHERLTTTWWAGQMADDALTDGRIHAALKLACPRAGGHGDIWRIAEAAAFLATFTACESAWTAAAGVGVADPGPGNRGAALDAAREAATAALHPAAERLRESWDRTEHDAWGKRLAATGADQ